MKVLLEQIEIYAGTQARQSIDDDTVTQYADRMTEGDQFPPVVLFHDGNTHYIGDGFHRVLASERNKFIDIEADVRKGTLQDALWFAIGANKVNGKNMTPGDRRRAVALALQTWPDKTQQAIADQVGCSQWLVSETQKQLIGDNKLTIPDTRVGADGKERPTTYQKKDTLEDRTETQQQEETPDETENRKDSDMAKKKNINPMPTKPKDAPPQMGIHFARLAILDLEKIEHNDTLKAEGINMVKDWINEHE